MTTRAPQILALGGGGFSMEKDSSVLDDYALSLAGSERPRVCFLPTASGVADHYVVRFYRRFSAGCEASHESLFRRDQGTGGVEDNLATHLLEQDLIYVGGGNVVSMLGAWRAHGLDGILRKAWRRGIVLCGPSAGSLCWFDQALSAFHGAPRPIDRRLAGARAGRDPAQGLAARHRAVRPFGGIAVLVRSGPERVPRRSPPDRSAPGGRTGWTGSCARPGGAASCCAALRRDRCAGSIRP